MNIADHYPLNSPHLCSHHAGVGLPLPGEGCHVDFCTDLVAWLDPDPPQWSQTNVFLFFTSHPPTPFCCLFSQLQRPVASSLFWGVASSSSSSPALSPLLCLRGLFSLAGQGTPPSPPFPLCLVFWALVSLCKG